MAKSPVRAPVYAPPQPLSSASDDPIPLYFRLQTILRAAIESLNYPPGSRLPTERRLAELYGVSRITVRQALDALAREGLIRRGRGRGGGTLVREASAEKTVKLSGSFEALFSKRQVSRIDILAFDIRRSNGEIGSALHLSPGADVRYIERILTTPAGPVAHVRNFVPLPLGARLTRRELKAMTLQEALVRRHGVKLMEVDDEIEATLADSHAARLLDVRPGRPLLSLRRVFLAAGDEPVNLTLLLIASDRYKMTLRLRGHVTD